MRGLNPLSLAQWCGGRWEHGVPPKLAAVSVDSRAAGADCLFVALRGEHCDGHDFVPNALHLGAAGAVVARTYARTAGAAAGPLLRVADPLQALQDMAAGYRRARGVRIVGVTGSAGKTTVKEMIADVLATQGVVARTRGNWNNNIGLPLSLLNMPADAQTGVFEVGVNHPGEMDPLCRVLAPDWGVVTNVGPVHLEFFESEQAIAREKSRLLRALPPAGVTVLRADVPWFDLLRAAAPGPVVTVALDDGRPAPPADYYARSRPDGLAILGERAAASTWSLRPSLPGRHNLANILLAAALGRTWGAPWPDIIRALENYRAPPMRWERCAWRGVAFINDAYNANPLSMAEALRTFQSLPGERKWLVLGGMLELGRDAIARHRELGRLVAANAWQGVITVGELASAVADMAADCGMPADRLFRRQTPADAAAVLARAARPDDLVLLKGSRGIGLEKVLIALRDLDASGIS